MFPYGTRLAIVGSTRFESPYGDMLAEWIIKRALMYFDPDVVVSGGAEGVDTLAERLAMQYGFSTHICLPAKPQWEPHGYKERNLRIVRNCTHLLSIRCSQSRTYGSGWTADRAEELGKLVVRRPI